MATGGFQERLKQETSRALNAKMVEVNRFGDITGYSKIIVGYFAEHGNLVDFCSDARTVAEDVTFRAEGIIRPYNTGEVVCLKTCGGCKVPVKYLNDSAIGAFPYSIPLTDGRAELTCAGGRTVKIELSD